MPKLTVELLPLDVQILTDIRDFMRGANRSPQAHEIVALKRRYKTDEEKRRIKRFEAMVLLGAIHHSRNGHCWLLPPGRTVVRDSEKEDG